MRHVRANHEPSTLQNHTMRHIVWLGFNVVTTQEKLAMGC